MFSFLLFSFINSISVPISLLSQPIIPIISLDEAFNLSLQNNSEIDLVFGFALNNETKLYNQIQGMVLQASVITHNAEFVILTKESTSKYTNTQNTLTPHTFFVIEKGEVTHCFPLPDSAPTFFSMIDFFATKEKTVFETKEEFLKYIGFSSYSLLSPPENISIAYYLQNVSSPAMGYIEIILCTKELIHELTNNENTTFGFYRYEDDYIQ